MRFSFRNSLGNGAWLLAASLFVAVATAQEPARPADAKPGNAVQEDSAKPVVIDYWDPKQFMIKGGFFMWPILGCSILSITFALERMISLRRRRVIPPAFVRRFTRRLENGELDRTSALDLCEANGSPIAALYQAAVRRWGRPAAEIDHAVHDAGEREVALLRRYLRALQGSANIAMLLGLLGTVQGMIMAFNQVAAFRGLGKAEVLAGGIATALLTTFFGLSVAIPSMVLYNYFCGKVERLVHDLDIMASDLTETISAEALAAAPPKKLELDKGPEYIKMSRKLGRAALDG